MKNVYEKFFCEVEKIEDEGKRSQFNTLFAAIQKYYSCKCQFAALEQVKKHVDKTYITDNNILDLKDFLIEEFYLKLYQNYVNNGSLDNKSKITTARLDYKDIIKNDFSNLVLLRQIKMKDEVTGEKLSLMKAMEDTCRKFELQYPAKEAKDGNLDCSFLDYFKKLHQYMGQYSENKELKIRDWKEAVRNIISEEGIEYLMQAIQCPAGMEALYIQPVRTMFVTNVDGTGATARNSSKKNFKKAGNSVTLAEKQEQIAAIIEQIEPLYVEYKRTKSALEKIERKLD